MSVQSVDGSNTQAGTNGQNDSFSEAAKNPEDTSSALSGQMSETSGAQSSTRETRDSLSIAANQQMNNLQQANNFPNYNIVNVQNFNANQNGIVPVLPSNNIDDYVQFHFDGVNPTSSVISQSPATQLSRALTNLADPVNGSETFRTLLYQATRGGHLPLDIHFSPQPGQDDPLDNRYFLPFGQNSGQLTVGDATNAIINTVAQAAHQADYAAIDNAHNTGLYDAAAHDDRGTAALLAATDHARVEYQVLSEARQVRQDITNTPILNAPVGIIANDGGDLGTENNYLQSISDSGELGHEATNYYHERENYDSQNQQQFENISQDIQNIREQMPILEGGGIPTPSQIESIQNQVNDLQIQSNQLLSFTSAQRSDINGAIQQLQDALDVYRTGNGASSSSLSSENILSSALTAALALLVQRVSNLRN